MRIGRRSSRLTRNQSEQLVARVSTPPDLSADLAQLAAVLAAAAAPARRSELEAESKLVSALAAEARNATISPSPSRERSRPRRRARFAAAFVGAALVLTGTLAAFGALPDAAQSVAHTVLAKIGINVPGPNTHAGDHPNTRGKSDEHKPSIEPTLAGKPSVLPRPLPSQASSVATEHVPSVRPTPSDPDRGKPHRP